MTRLQIRIGGVPEHFNVLWHYAASMNYFADAGLDVTWIDYPSGSAPMARDLNDRVIDLAVTLTESITASILNGTQAKIVGWYVASPLIWGIHTGAHSPITSTDDMIGKRYAISRFGSGSHLMALVDAANRGITIRPEQFIVVDNLAGAVKALSSDAADLFFWEMFTTKSYVDTGIFRRIGDCPTPWPCFVIAAGTEFLAEHSIAVNTIRTIIYRAAVEFRALENNTILIATRYGLKLVDIDEWYKTLAWADYPALAPKDFEAIVLRLSELGVIPKPTNLAEAVAQLL